MKKRKGFGQLIITFAFAYSALLCHFHASELRENGDMYTALLYWFFGLTALAGAFRFRIASIIEKLREIQKIIEKISDEFFILEVVATTTKTKVE